MMSPKRWILLLIFYISYLMFGASIYYHIEHGLEKQQRAVELKERIDIHEYLLDQLADRNTSTQNTILKRISDYCDKPVTDYRNDKYEIPYTWTFYHSFFFAFTVCSTVGYGNIAPTTTLGRMIMIAYSVIGIPVNSILFAGLGEYFGRVFQSIYHRYKKYKMSTDIHYVPPQLSLITTILIALVPGITMFLLIPSWVFSYFEDWPYSLAFYYAYVTTTTIGFGDYVPTFQPQQHREFGIWFVVYQIFIIVWFIFSLGYLLMIMTFITRGLRSKKLAHLEQQLSSNIKATQHRIWNGVTKDISAIRRIFNELYLLKFKPVYTKCNEPHCLNRSISCPDLTIYRMEPISEHARKRAFSECYDGTEARTDGTPFSLHANSDTELNKIDRQKSFETAEAFRQTTNLLAKVVNALAAIAPPTLPAAYDGDANNVRNYYHGFTDSQILASEWPFNGDLPKQRERACSECNTDRKWQKNLHNTANDHNEWTWSGDNNQIQEAINIRYRQKDQYQHLYPNSFGQIPLNYIVNMEGEEATRKTRSKKFSIPDGIRKLFPFRKRALTADFERPETNVNARDRKISAISVPEVKPHCTSDLNYYSTVTANASPTYFINGKLLHSSNLYPSASSLCSKLSLTDNKINDLNDQTTVDFSSATYLKRHKRENGTLIGEKPDKFSLMQTERRCSVLSNNYDRSSNVLSNTIRRHNSVFPTTFDGSRRPSIFSATSQEDREVLENTTLADLIRVLEVMHTQAILGEAADSLSTASARGDNEAKKKRKIGSVGLDITPMFPMFLPNDNDKTLSATAVNRLYARRSTVVGTLSQSPQQSITSNSSISNIITRRRQSQNTQIVELPPIYTETSDKDMQNSANTLASRFKRRFSIRPTALQIPPGKAPPPESKESNELQQQQQQMPLAIAGANASTQILLQPTQNVLQKRLSLKPSPLAQINTVNINPSGPADNVRALPRNTTSTHSPLSRIVQISQAKRKSSMTDEFGTRWSDK
ncbi:open rectifier K[+] channel 1 isoform 1-T7 [Glossina fuscipes fuscipes]